KLARWPCFNPLRIGEVIPTVCRRERGFPQALWQVSIPFASGKSFQHAHARLRRFRFNSFVSIPFASGNTFQPSSCNISACSISRTVSISFASGNTFQPDQVSDFINTVSEFQSPSHRGRRPHLQKTPLVCVNLSALRLPIYSILIRQA